MTKEKLNPNEIANYVKRWGCSASIALLDPNCEIFHVPDQEGLIGYRSKGKHAFVFGDPVCESSAKIHLAKAFDAYCKDRNIRIVYTQISDDFSQWALKYYNGALIEVGEELYVNPCNDPTEGQDARMLRKKINHASREGTTVQEYIHLDPLIEAGMEDVKRAWLNSRKGPQIFLSHIYLFENRTGKRWFYATQNNKVVGLCLLNKLESRKGWVLNLALAAPDAPNGTTELLITTVLEHLRTENCQYLTFGVVPVDRLEKIVGLSCFTSWLARQTFKSIMWMFKLNGKRTYWQKYKPNFDKSHLLFTQQNVGLIDFFDLLRSLNLRL